LARLSARSSGRIALNVGGWQLRGA
jgi:hypothetical protein